MDVSDLVELVLQLLPSDMIRYFIALFVTILSAELSIIKLILELKTYFDLQFL